MRKLIVALALASVTAGGIAALALAGTTAAGTKNISVGDNFYSRSKVTIRKGSSVKWTWTGANPHTVTAYRGSRFHSAEMTTGTYTHKFRRDGTFKVLCRVHPTEMRMTIRVLG